jgi:hypothetical protein
MGNRQKRKRRQKRRARARPNVARNPGVSSLLLVNPAPAPKAVPAPKKAAPAPSPATIKREIHSAVATALKERKMPKRARRPEVVGKKVKRRGKRRGHRPQPHAAHAQPTVQIITGNGQTSVKPKIRRKRDNQEFDLNLSKQYRGIEPRKGRWRGKHEKRGIKTLERHKKSILWNLGKGSPGAQQWVLDHIPKINPAADVKNTAKDIGVGVASFLGARVIGNVASKLPGLSHFGSIASVGASAAVTGLSYFLLGKKWPQLKKPLLFGGALALIDSILKNLLVPHLPPKVAGVLGDASAPPLEDYREPVGYLPPHDPMDGVGCYGDIDPAEWERIHREQLYANSLMDFDGMGLDVHEAMADDGMGLNVHEAMADDGMGIAVHEAMADSGDGLGMEVHPAQAGVDDMGAYVSTGTGGVEEGQAYGAYVPTGTGAYVPSMSGMGAYVPSMSGVDAKDVAAMIFGGPAGYAYALGRRRRRHRHPRHHGRFGWPHYPRHYPRASFHLLPPHMAESQRAHSLMGDDDWSSEEHEQHHRAHRHHGRHQPRHYDEQRQYGHPRHGHHRHRHHGYQHGHRQPIHADCDIYLPHDGHRQHQHHHHGHHGHVAHHGHPAHEAAQASTAVHPSQVVGPPPALPANKPAASAPLATGTAGGIFAHHD